MPDDPPRKKTGEIVINTRAITVLQEIERRERRNRINDHLKTAKEYLDSGDYLMTSVDLHSAIFADVECLKTKFIIREAIEKIGKTLFKLSDEERGRAIAFLKSINQVYASCYLELAHRQMEFGNKKEAVKYYRRAISIDSSLQSSMVIDPTESELKEAESNGDVVFSKEVFSLLSDSPLTAGPLKVIKKSKLIPLPEEDEDAIILDEEV